MNKLFCLSLVLFCGLFLGSPASATSLLIVQGPGGGGFGGYGDGSYYTYTNIYNTTFGGAANITLTADLTNSSQVDASDAIVVELRNGSDVLSALEIANLSSFIASGRRVVLFGENTSWQTWDTSILSLVGGAYGGSTPIQGPNGTSVNYAIPVSSFVHPLTSGMTQIDHMHGSVAIGGTALFDYANIGTLWGANLNVLTYLSFNEFFNGGAPSQDKFNQNIADWLYASTPSQEVPEPVTAALLSLGLVLVGFRKIRH